MWDKAKALFRRSRTILIARLYTVVGVIVGGAPFVAGFDWTPLIRRAFYFVPDDLMPLAVGGFIALTGLVFEWLRTITTDSLTWKKEETGVRERFNSDVESWNAGAGGTPPTSGPG